MVVEESNIDDGENTVGPLEKTDFAAEQPRAKPVSSIKNRLPLNRPNLLLLGLFIAGLAGVYVYSLREGPETASAEQRLVEAQVNSAIMGLRSNPVGKISRQDRAAVIVETFYYEAKQRQIPLESLNCNPFIFTPPESAATTALKPQLEELPKPSASAQRELSDALAAVKQLKLQSVMMGSHGAMAMISNNLLTEGQQISGWTVRSIRPREVVLTWGSQEYLLIMPK